jgi:putative redox protein
METNGERASAATPVELLLLAIGGRMASDVVGILRKKREQVTDYCVELSGERRSDFPRSFKSIRMYRIILGRNVSEAPGEQAIRLSDTKYCSVAAALRSVAAISVTFEILEEITKS